MTKLESLITIINTLPDDMAYHKSFMTRLVEKGNLDLLRSYVRGTYDMAEHLTSDERILAPLRDIREMLE